MIKFFAAADGPRLVIRDRKFTEPVEVVCGQTYGRILFRPDIFVTNCEFDLRNLDAAGLTLDIK